MRALWGWVFILAAAFCAGWVARGWHDAKLLNAANASAEETRLIVAEMNRQAGEQLEVKLAELSENDTHTERVIHTETIKPVFSNICATDDYVRLLNEGIDKASRTLAGEPAGTLPGQPAKTGGADGN